MLNLKILILFKKRKFFPEKLISRHIQYNMLPNELTRREYNGKNSCDPEPSKQSDPNPKKYSGSTTLDC
jgi:hypothetical protein